MPSRNYQAPNLDFTNVLSLLELCVKCKINCKIKKSIKDKLIEKAGKEGAQCASLTWAGERKDVGIARLALSQMNIQIFLHPRLPNKLDPAQWDDFLFWDVMTKLPSLWQLTIWRPTIQ
ncbi:hypothetical protein V865_007193 [Kwoniella europaea PYCC6329]|uniref:Uncharacterized protein n=1 Tax=Kwoniella europaea PYCC6329 TaxID=1423913 RepID=A0AAX4KS20_9TREE